MRHRTVAVALAAVVAVAAAGTTALTWRPAIDEISPPSGFDRALVAKGAQLAAVGDCAICHAGANGAPYAGGNPIHTPFGAIYATNITPDPDTGIGTWSEAAFRRAMQQGVDRTGRFLYPAFPYNHYTHVTDGDVAAIYAFLMTREPVHAVAPAARLPFPLDIRAVMAGWNLLFLDDRRFTPDPAKSAEWNRGAYLVEGLGHCAACHSPHNAFGAEDTAHPFTGGEADGWEAPGLTAATSPAAIAWSADALFDYLRHGLNDQHAAAAGPMNAVSHDLSQVPEADVRAMAVYIASFTGGTDTGGSDTGGSSTGGTREQQVAAKAAAAQTPPPALQASEGATIFAGACAGCHGAGAPMMLNGRPSLALGSAVTAATPRNATQIILHGLQPRPGERGPWMPPFAGSLTDSQVAAVLGYLRARFTDRPAWANLEDTVRSISQDGRS
jgi:mono/diheme cytochrome c family protein